MAQDSQPSPFFTHIDVSTQSSMDSNQGGSEGLVQVSSLLHQLVATQTRQNELLEELIQQTTAAQKQRANELGQWKDSNPHLARRCRAAAEALSHVQTDFLEKLTDEITDNAEDFVEGDFLMNEFVDRYGPRLAHLNGVLQVLSQLSSSSNVATGPPSH